jgi:hypothetical protein
MALPSSFATSSGQLPDAFSWAGAGRRRRGGRVPLRSSSPFPGCCSAVGRFPIARRHGHAAPLASAAPTGERDRGDARRSRSPSHSACSLTEPAGRRRRVFRRNARVRICPCRPPTYVRACMRRAGYHTFTLRWSKFGALAVQWFCILDKSALCSCATHTL